MHKLLNILFIATILAACKKEDPDPHIENWCLVFEDEFDTIDQYTWQVFDEPKDITARTGRSDNLRTENGLLIMELHKENYNGLQYTGSEIASRAYYLYGRIECRAKLPGANTAWPAFWLLGSYEEYGPWPNCGEIDIMEYWGKDAPNFYTNIHSKHSNWKNGKDRDRHSTSVSVPNASEQFHVYGVHWYKDRLEFYLDGKHYWTFNKFANGWRKWPFDHPMRIVLQMYATPDYDGSDADLPDIFEVDWVRVYEGCP